MTYPSAPGSDPTGNPNQQPDPYQQPNPYEQPYQQPNPYEQPYQASTPPQYGNPYAQPNPYGTGVPAAQPPQTTNGFAIASLITGILGIPVAIILGIVAFVQIPKRNQKGKGMAVAGIILSVVWLLGCAGLVAVAIATDDNKPDTPSITLPQQSTKPSPSAAADDALVLGDCINGLLSQDLDKELDENPPKVDCAEPHEGEVFKVVTLTGTTFPGDSAVQKKAEDGCSEAALNAYAPDEKKTAKLDIYFLYPTSRSWRSGDRDITCLIVNEKAKMTGSLHG